MAHSVVFGQTSFLAQMILVPDVRSSNKCKQMFNLKLKTLLKFAVKQAVNNQC